MRDRPLTLLSSCASHYAPGDTTMCAVVARCAMIAEVGFTPPSHGTQPESLPDSAQMLAEVPLHTGSSTQRQLSLPPNPA